MHADQVPLFPLPRVLFPDGELALRIFEPRYLDLVRWCTREQRPFGVCLQLADGSTAVIGTLARIEDFSSRPDGLLGIHCLGGQRFHVERTRVRDNGLIQATVRLLATPAAQPVRPEHALLAQLVERMLERAGGRHARAERARLQCADWVGCRLAELLPLAEPERQRLLEAVDPHQRLQQIVDQLSERAAD